jgi:DNA modification methylase
VALNDGRRFIGIELKKSYWDQAVKNLAAAEPTGKGKQVLLDLGETK